MSLALVAVVGSGCPHSPLAIFSFPITFCRRRIESINKQHTQNMHYCVLPVADLVDRSMIGSSHGGRRQLLTLQIVQQ